MNNDNMPFVSPPISCEPTMMAVDQVQYDYQADMFENEYPEIYHDVYPLILEAANKLMAGGYTVTHDMIDSLVDTIIKNSGMWYEDDEDNSMMSDAIPVQLGFGRTPLQRHRRRHHNRNTLRDIVRILFLRELFDRKDRRFY